MFSFGFYNSINGDRRYNATHFSKMFDGIILDGILGGMDKPLDSMFKVEPTSPAGNEVIINPGKAWLMKTWNILDAKTLISIPEVSNTKNKRTDIIAIEVNDNWTELEGSYPRTNRIVRIEGALTLASGADNIPSLVQEWNTTKTEKRIWQYPIAYVTMYGGDIKGGNEENSFERNIIKAANIKSRINVTGETEANKWKTWTPLVTGATMNTDINNYLPNFNNMFNDMLDDNMVRFNYWFDRMSRSIVGDFVIASELKTAFNETSDDVMDPEKTYYEFVNDVYVVTSDSEFISGKTYYEYKGVFQNILTYYEKDENNQYFPTEDTQPDPSKTYYIFDTSDSLVELEKELDNKIIYGYEGPPSDLKIGQVYLQLIEE